MGFWNVSAPEGTWRLIACHRHGAGPGAGHEEASVLSWTNKAAADLCRSMLGLCITDELSDMLSPKACARALALGSVHTASIALDTEWAEAPHFEPTSFASSATNRFLIFGQGELEHMAAAFEMIARSSGGTARHSSERLALKAAHIREAHEADFAWDLSSASFSAARESISPKTDLFWATDSKNSTHRVDIRAAARALGLPWRASISEPNPGMQAGQSFLDTERIARRISEMGDDAFGQGFSLRFDRSIDGPLKLDSFGVDALQALQDSSALKRSTLHPAAASEPKVRRAL
jgi:hypothetical protein